MPQKGQGRHQKLLADPDVARWHNNLARKSKANANNMLRMLGVLLEWRDITPAEFVAMPAKERDDYVDDFMTQKAESVAGASLRVYKRAAQSWLKHHGQRLTRDIAIANAHVSAKAATYQIPSQDTVRRLLNAADARDRVAIAFMAFSGVRPMVLGDYEGTDGLRLGHIDGLVLEDGELIAKEIPAPVRVPSHLSKTRKPYMTFMGPQGLDYLATYVRERVGRGEDVTLDSLVYSPERSSKPAVRSQLISDNLRPILRNQGLKEPPYILRSYFETRCLHAEADGLTKEMRDFLMGHAGTMGARYSYHKQLPADTKQLIIDGYQAALPFLETRTQEGPRVDPFVETARVLLMASGYDEERILELDLSSKSEAEIIELLNESRGAPVEVAATPKQRLIGLDELDVALSQGWVFRQELSNGRVLVEIS